MPHSTAATPTSDLLAFARGVLEAEAAAVAGLVDQLGEPFERAIQIMRHSADNGGSVLLAGIGKSGLIGRKISATLASLGVPSHDIHPTEAMHGDLGRINKHDCLIALSFSGETDELVALAAILKQDGIPIISITGSDQCSLGRLASAALTLGPLREASAMELAPSCSTTATLAMGDALALTLANLRAFTADDFARRHPGGSLGGKLKPIVELLRFRVGENLPVVDESMTVRDALAKVEGIGRRPGALIAIDSAGKVAGILTDSDVRRLVTGNIQALDGPLSAVMTRSPRTLPSTALVRDAQRMVREYRSDEIPIVDANGTPIGLLDVQDLIAQRLVDG